MFKLLNNSPNMSTKCKPIEETTLSNESKFYSEKTMADYFYQPDIDSKNLPQLEFDETEYSPITMEEVMKLMEKQSVSAEGDESLSVPAECIPPVTKEISRKAPYFPAIHLPTFFLTQSSLEDIIEKLMKYLEQSGFRFKSEKDGFRFYSDHAHSETEYTFYSRECSFYCIHHTNWQKSTRFVIRVYCFPETSDHKDELAVELQKVEGDGWTFRTFFIEVRDLLSSV